MSKSQGGLPWCHLKFLIQEIYMSDVNTVSCINKK